MMKKILGISVTAMILLAACTPPYKKAGEGVEYKIISDGKAPVIKTGQFFEIHFTQRYKGTNKDTLLFNSYDMASQVIPLDSTVIPPMYYKIFSQIRKGDSVIVRQLTDSIMKKSQPGQIPPYFKKGAYVVATYKVMNVFDTKAAADSATKAQMVIARARDSVKAEILLKKDDKTIADYLKKNNIQATKAPLGTYVQIINPGEGEVADTSKVMKVFYTGRLFDGGKVFDSNLDSTRNPEHRPYNVFMSRVDEVIKGWGDGLKLLKKGAKAKFYIPSSLAYGSRGMGGDIPANSILVFDIEIADMISAAQARAEEEAEYKKMEADHKRFTDSIQRLQNARKADAGKEK